MILILFRDEMVACEERKNIQRGLSALYMDLNAVSIDHNEEETPRSHCFRD
jgi:hypothetical protein